MLIFVSFSKLVKESLWYRVFSSILPCFEITLYWLLKKSWQNFIIRLGLDEQYVYMWLVNILRVSLKFNLCNLIWLAFIFCNFLNVKILILTRTVTVKFVRSNFIICLVEGRLDFFKRSFWNVVYFDKPFNEIYYSYIAILSLNFMKNPEKFIKWKLIV